MMYNRNEDKFPQMIERRVIYESDWICLYSDKVEMPDGQVISAYHRLHYPEQGYPLAECQVGYFYYEGLGTVKDLTKAFLWTKRAAEHGDRDAQCNLAEFYLEGTGTDKDLESAEEWYIKAARQGNDYAMERCRALGIELPPEEACLEVRGNGAAPDSILQEV